MAQAKLSCSVDGPDGSTYCDSIARQRTCRTVSGLRVMELYLELVNERFGPPLQRKVSTVGPVYVDDLSRPGYIFDLPVGSGHNSPCTPEDQELVQ